VDVPGPVLPAVCSALAAHVFFVGASLVDGALPPGSCVFASGQVHCCLRPVSLPLWPRVAGHCPHSAPLRVLRRKLLHGEACSPMCFPSYSVRYLLFVVCVCGWQKFLACCLEWKKTTAVAAENHTVLGEARLDWD
jgi:hypothetical protein